MHRIIHRHKQLLTRHQKVLRLVVVHIKRWLPIVILTSFTVGVLASVFIVRGQDILTNAVQIGELKSDMHDVQRDVQDLKDMPLQMGTMRERVVKIESDVAQLRKSVDGIDSKGDWLVFGVFGLLLSAVIKGIKFGRSEPESDHFPLVKP